MLILAIDTSGKDGSIALARVGEGSGDENDCKLVAQVSLAGGTFSAQLIPQIVALLSSSGFNKRDIEALAAASGPGSFTGLRVGLAAVKALGEALRIPIIAVSLLEACVWASGEQGRVMAALDAGRGEVYVGEYEIPNRAAAVSTEHLLNRSEFVSHAQGWTVVSPDSSLTGFAAENGVATKTLARLSAVDVARLGWQKLRAGETVTPDQLEANYIRRTDAELLAKIGS